MNNFVAKHARTYNKAHVFIDRKKQYNRTECRQSTKMKECEEYCRCADCEPLLNGYADCE
ncbi:MAG: DUF7230 family protein [Bacilli bacterium]